MSDNPNVTDQPNSLFQRITRATIISSANFALGFRDAMYRNTDVLSADHPFLRQLCKLRAFQGLIIGYMSTICREGQQNTGFALAPNCFNSTFGGIAHYAIIRPGITFAGGIAGSYALLILRDTASLIGTFISEENTLLRSPPSEEAFQIIRSEQRHRPIRRVPLEASEETHRRQAQTAFTAHLSPTLPPSREFRQVLANQIRDRWSSLVAEDHIHRAEEICPITLKPLLDPEEAISKPVAIHSQSGIFEYDAILTSWVHKPENPLTRQGFTLADLRKINTTHIINT